MIYFGLSVLIPYGIWQENFNFILLVMYFGYAQVISYLIWLAHPKVTPDMCFLKVMV